MKGTRKPVKPMDDTLRRRGLILGAAGIVSLFGSSIALLFTPNEFLAFLFIPMLAGFILLVVGYVDLRRAERAIFEHELTKRKP